MNQETAIAVQSSAVAVAKSLPLDEVQKRLEFVKQVMKNVLREDVDYGKIPGCGPKPALFQPGAQKLGLTFQLHPQVLKETLREYPGFHREYEITVRVGGEFGSDGVGSASTLESKHRYRLGQRVCPECGQPAIIRGKAEFGGGYFCFEKKGGCGAKFAPADPAIEDQEVGQIENPNPPDAWNTCRKMAFKRAFVHAIINATNTSELWTQDWDEDDADNTPPPTKKKSSPKKTTNATADETKKRAEDDSNPDLTPKEGNSAPPPEELREGQFRMSGIVEFVAAKSGKKKSGDPYTRYGVKLRVGQEEIWVNTFSETLGKLSEKLKGKEVTVTYEEEEYNGDTVKNLVGINL